jgi:hypothetical protein
MDRRDRLAWLALGAAVTVLWPGAAPRADLLRCKGPDGKTIYTDNKALCPEAKPFEPAGAIQPGPPAANESGDPLADRQQRAADRQRQAETEAGEAARWRDRNRQLSEALAGIQERRSYLASFLAMCNRGGSVITRDAAGIKRPVPCKDIRAEYASLADEEARAQAALDELPEECRRAGCLPGWIR